MSNVGQIEGNWKQIIWCGSVFSSAAFYPDRWEVGSRWGFLIGLEEKTWGGRRQSQPSSSTFHLLERNAGAFRGSHKEGRFMVGLLSKQGRSTCGGQNTQTYEKMTGSNTVRLSPNTRHFYLQQIRGMWPSSQQSQTSYQIFPARVEFGVGVDFML